MSDPMQDAIANLKEMFTRREEVVKTIEEHMKDLHEIDEQFRALGILNASKVRPKGPAAGGAAASPDRGAAARKAVETRRRNQLAAQGVPSSPATKKAAAQPHPVSAEAIAFERRMYGNELDGGKPSWAEKIYKVLQLHREPMTGTELCEEFSGGRPVTDTLRSSIFTSLAVMTAKGVLARILPAGKVRGGMYQITTGKVKVDTVVPPKSPHPGCYRPGTVIITDNDILSVITHISESAMTSALIRDALDKKFPGRGGDSITTLLQRKLPILVEAGQLVRKIYKNIHTYHRPDDNKPVNRIEKLTAASTNGHH